MDDLEVGDIIKVNFFRKRGLFIILRTTGSRAIYQPIKGKKVYRDSFVLGSTFHRVGIKNLGNSKLTKLLYE